MKNFFLQDLKRSIINPGFWAGMVFAFAILLPAAVLDTPLNGSRSLSVRFREYLSRIGFFALCGDLSGAGLCCGLLRGV